jgi:rhodanese-related sulfurtransferase
MVPPAELQEEISPEQAQELLAEGAQLIDVREAYEHDAGRIAGGRHIEFDRLTAEAESIDRDRPVLFYCRVGNRSAVAAEAFRAAGYQASNLAGGLVAWVESGLPLEPEDGEVAPH